MDLNQQNIIRQGIEIQFRHNLYKDIKFPFLQSIGINHLLKGFQNDEVGFVGVLHMWWVNEDNGIHYLDPKKSAIKIKGIWKSEWLDTNQEAIEIIQKIQNDSIIDTNKLIEVFNNDMKNRMDKKVQKEIEEQLKTRSGMKEKEEEKKILWN